VEVITLKARRERSALRGDETVFFWATRHREIMDIMDGNKYGFEKLIIYDYMYNCIYIIST